MSIDKSKLKRDYEENPIIIKKNGKGSEIPFKEDLEYLYLELNLSQPQLEQYFNVSRRVLQRWLKVYHLFKTNEQRLINSSTTLKNKTKEQIEEMVNKIKQTKLQRYGNENYNNRKKSIETCMNKYKVINVNQRHISQNTLQIISNKDKLVEYINDNQIINATDLADRLSMSEPQIARYIVKYDLKELFDYSKSSLENNIKTYVNQYYKTENNVKLLDGKEIDIYIPEKKMGIEINGNYWHSEYHKDRLYHQNKSLLAESKGIFIYHIFEYEWNNKREQIINQLNNLLGLNNRKIYARKCLIKTVDNKDCKMFLENNHLQGNDKSKIKLGLYYDNELVSIMTFVKPRFNKEYDWELSRFCSLSNTNVIGGASKLFNYFVNNYQPSSIISYSNIAHTKGNVYGLLGFKLNNIAQPNYIWFNHGVIKTRYDCQKYRLIKQGLIGNSETEIMHNNGYYRIYDCGNKVWVWNK